MHAHRAAAVDSAEPSWYRSLCVHSLHERYPQTKAPPIDGFFLCIVPDREGGPLGK